MTYRFDAIERLGLLAALALDVLDEEFTEGQLDDDANPPRTELYNLADAVLTLVGERRFGDTPIMGFDRDAIADALLTGIVEYAGDDGRVGTLWARLRAEAER